MAENIRVAKFDINTDDAIANAIKLKNEIDRLRQSTATIKKEMALADKQYKETAAVMNAMRARGEEETKGYKEKEQELKRLSKQLTDYTGTLVLNDATIKRHNAELRATNNLIGSQIDVTGKRVSLQERANRVLDVEAQTIAEARAHNTDLLAVRNQLNPAIEEEAKLMEELNRKLDANNNFIKENASAYERQKINIGNYKNDIISAYQEMQKEKEVLDSLNRELVKAQAETQKGSDEWLYFNQQIQQNNQQINILIANMGGMNQEVEANNVVTNLLSGNFKAIAMQAQEAGGASKLFTNTLQGLGKGIVGVTRASLAFLATPIGAVIGAIGLVLGTLITYLKSTQSGIDAITSVTRPLSAVFEALIGIVQKLGEFLVNAFLNPKKYLTELYDYIKDKVMRYFQGLYDIAVGLATLDFKQAKKGLSSIGEVAEDVFNDARNAVTGFIDEMDEAWKKGQEIDRLQKEIERREIDIIALRAESERQLKEAELIARDTSKTTEERRKAMEEMEKITRRLVAEENKILDAKIKQMEIQQSLNDTSREDEAELERLRAERMKSDDKVTDLQRTNLRVLNQIRNEDAQKAKQQADKAYQRETTRMNETLNLWIAQQGIRAKTLQEQLEEEREIADASMKILDYELENKKISQEQYATEVLKIQNNLAMLTNQLVVENAERELAEFIRVNESKIEKGKIFTAEELEAEKERLKEIERLEREYELIRLQNGVITKLEYNDLMLELDKKYLENRNELYKEFDQSQRLRELAERELQHQQDLIDMEQRGAAEFERKQYQIDMQHQQELERMLERAEAEGWTEEMINEATMNREQLWNAERLALLKTTEEEMANFRLATAQNTASMIGAIAGKESALGKAMAITSIIQEKARAVSEIRANIAIANAKAKNISPATLGQPWVGFNTAFAVAQTGATVGLAAKSINEIRSAGTKKMYTGGYTGDGGKFEVAPAEIHRGEYVIDAETTRMLGLPFLNSLRSRATENGFVQDSITSNVVSIKQEDINSIVEGVARGSAVGTSKGFRDLTTDRQVMENSKF